MTAIEPLSEIPDAQTTAVTIGRLRDAGILGDCYADFSLVLPLVDEDADYDRYEAIGRFLSSSFDAARWWLVDWLIFGEGVFGDRFYQATEATGLSEETLRSFVRLGEQVTRGHRRPDLHFSHHREVAKLNPEEQDYWLQRAVDRSLSARELREEIVQARADSTTSSEPESGHPDVELVRVDKALLRAIVDEASQADDPRYVLIANELVARLKAALGDE